MHKTWIFQGNPERFDIDGYLAACPNRFVWQVNQHAVDIGPGDRVFVWKSAAGERGAGGVCAEAIVATRVSDRYDDPRSKPFWKDQSELQTIRPRVELDVVRIANKKQMLRRDWLLEDPVLSALPILKMASGTNFSVPEPLQRRLLQMWARTGRDWDEQDSVAGLWAYVQTLGKEISKKPGSPVAHVSMLTGRAISGVYNKVMNFRALDPRDTRTGMSGASEMDRRVWSRFYDEDRREIDVSALNAEFERAWSAQQPADESATAANELAKQIRRLEEKTDEELLAEYRRREQQRAGKKPRRSSVSTTQIERDPLVVLLTKRRAGYRCEIEDCASAVFFAADGTRYCEVHHIQQLALDGLDVIENTACLCANHHREVHFGSNAAQLTTQLRKIRSASASADNAIGSMSAAERLEAPIS